MDQNTAFFGHRCRAGAGRHLHPALSGHPHEIDAGNARGRTEFRKDQSTDQRRCQSGCCHVTHRQLSLLWFAHAGHIRAAGGQSTGLAADRPTRNRRVAARCLFMRQQRAHGGLLPYTSAFQNDTSAALRSASRACNRAHRLRSHCECRFSSAASSTCVISIICMRVFMSHENFVTD